MCGHCEFSEANLSLSLFLESKFAVSRIFKFQIWFWGREFNILPSEINNYFELLKRIVQNRPSMLNYVRPSFWRAPLDEEEGGRGGGNFGGAYFSLARKVNRATRLYPGPWIRTPGGQRLMSASSAFGSQSSRSPQARAPILALSLSPPSLVCSNPFFPSFHPKANPIGTRFYFSRSSRFILHALPWIHDSLPSIFIPRNPRFLPFFFTPPSQIFCLFYFSFFFKIRDDEISFSFFFFLLLLEFRRISSNSNSISLFLFLWDYDYKRWGELRKRVTSIDDTFEMLEIKIDRGVETAYSSDL